MIYNYVKRNQREDYMIVRLRSKSYDIEEVRSDVQELGYSCTDIMNDLDGTLFFDFCFANAESLTEIVQAIGYDLILRSNPGVSNLVFDICDGSEEV